MAKNNILYQYQNGNTNVTIYEDGTKVREFEGKPQPVHPESLDIKITNYCDLGCKFCHESSTTEGNHADIEKLKEILDELPQGVEFAIGGGNPLAHPEILDLLDWCCANNFIPNMTVNQKHLKKYESLLTYIIKTELVKGVGISISDSDYSVIKKLKELSPHIVYHVIAGIHKPEIIDELMEFGNCKILILGYKTFGRGKDYYSPEIDECLKEWKEKLPNYFGKCLLSFDNLALEQLDVQSMLPKKYWEQCYMGDDFTFTMYIDAVEEQYAPTSRSSDRVSFNDMPLLEYFQTYKN